MKKTLRTALVAAAVLVLLFVGTGTAQASCDHPAPGTITGDVDVYDQTGPDYGPGNVNAMLREGAKVTLIGMKKCCQPNDWCLVSHPDIPRSEGGWEGGWVWGHLMPDMF